MSGTITGGKKTAETIKKLYGDNFYRELGRKGGQKGTTGGFYYSKVNGLDTHIRAGQKGGKISKRGKSVS